MRSELLQKLRDRLTRARQRLEPLTDPGRPVDYCSADARVARELTEVTSIVEEILESTR
jgi:hypothetical protein